MLRVGIMLDSYLSSAWIAKVVGDIQSSEFARVELVIVDTPVPEFPVPLHKKLSSLWSHSLFRLYEQWDYRRNKSKLDALAPTDLTPLLKGVSSISIASSRTKNNSAIFPEREGSEISNHKLDVIFYFGIRPLQGTILVAARYGIWAFRPGTASPSSHNAPLFWELYTRNPVTQSNLHILSDSPDGNRILYQSCATTDFHSLVRNRNPVYWKTAEFALRCLRGLHSQGDVFIRLLPASPEGSIGKDDGRAPNAFQVFLFMARYAMYWLDSRIAALHSGPRAKWCIAIRRRGQGRRFDDPAGYHLMRSAKDRFHADPFLIERDGKTFLFFEDFRFSLGRAIISCCEFDANGNPGEHTEVLRRPYHLSYPFLFEDQGEIYMLPETRGNRTVELYRATNFPYEWTADSVLLTDVDIVDATIQKINGKYWMFAGISNGRFSNCDELGLFFADSLNGPWTSHPKTPLISDVQRARPAGALFYEGERLIRPSQDCGEAYGYALVFSEIVTLSETDYEERFISRLLPGTIEGNLANHTYNRTEHFEVVDRNFPAKIATEPTRN